LTEVRAIGGAALFELSQYTSAAKELGLSREVLTENNFDRVQQPTKFDFSTNLRTAKQLGIEIPLAMLAIADRVIE
jgi:hypothetical protein